jgi:uncharacterized membrane protein YccF (DUF307 family)
MSLIGNILWIVFGGLVASLLYLLGGVVLCLTVVGIPFGLQCFRMAGSVLAPFGKEVTSVPSEGGVMGMLFNLLWIFLFGWGIAVSHLVSALICGLTIIGIPFAIQHVKLVVVALLPFGHKLQPV